MYSNLGNTSQVFELQLKLKEMKQEFQSVTQYFSNLQDLWQELNLFLKDDSTCAECNVKQQRNLEKECVYDFLVKLNRNLDEVRDQVSSRIPFPNTEKAFIEVWQEECQPRVMLPNDGPPSQTTPNGSTLLSKNIPPTGQAKKRTKDSMQRRKNVVRSL